MARAPKTTRVVLTDEVKAGLAEAPHRVLVSPFKRLVLQGLERIAPILEAALATEEPLLLIGPHGTAKSLLLTRVAAALRLEFRHCNVSQLNFDDLVGFLLLDKDRRLKAAVAGQAAEVYRDVAPPPNLSESLHASYEHFQTSAKVKGLLSRLDPTEPRSHLRATEISPQQLPLCRGASTRSIFTPEER